MKKRTKLRWLPFTLNYNLKMKLTTMLLIVTLFKINANSYSQNTRISLDMTQASVEDVLTEIESLSDFKFFVDTKKIDVKRKVTIKEEKQRIFRILERLFSGTSVTYEVFNKQIILKKEDTAPVPVLNTQTPEEVQQQVSGTVADKDGVPLPGASIVEKGTSNGTQSDFDGNFSIRVADDNAILVISYIGFATQEIVVAGQSNITITLEESAAGLDEVVVVGYGTSKRRDITGAIETFAGKTIEDKAVVSVPQLLQGRLPGLNINYGSGGIDATPNINIRGPESINGGDPLILIDGIPSAADILTQINPNNIENISVLKDAASAAIYGSRAAFGVILVTTKTGKFNQKFSVTAENFVKVTKQTEFPEFVDSYTHAITVNEALANNGENPRFAQDWLRRAEAYHNDPANNPVDEIINPEYDSQGNLIAGDYFFYGTVDYMNAVYNREAYQTKSDIRISGGGENTSIFASLGYTKDEGFYKTGNDDLNIYNFRVNTTSKVTDWLKIGTRTNYIKHVYNRPYPYIDFYSLNYFQRTYFPLRNRGNGHFLQHTYGYLSSGARDIFTDDVITLNLNSELQLAKNLKAVAEVNYQSDIGLNKEEVYQIDFSDNFGYRFPITALWNGLANQSWIYHRTRREKSLILDLYSTYQKTFNDKHQVEATIGFNQQSFNRLANTGRRTDIVTESVPSQNLTTGEQTVTQSETDWAIRGGFYRLKYIFDDKYIFTFNGRYDGTSRFAKDNRFVFNPSASVGWRLSSEKFMDFSDNWLNNLMFRASYGSIGNQDVANYAYIPTLGFDGSASYLFDGETNAVTITGAPGLVSPNLTWETVTTLNFGADFSVLDNRLSGSFEYYIRTTKDMLVNGSPVPGILGTGAPQANAADLEVKGYEATLRWRDNIGDFSYGIGLNFYDSRGWITKYKLNPTNLLSADFYEGGEIGQIWGFETEGIFQTDAEAAEANAGGSNDQSELGFNDWQAGDIKYKDINGDGVIDFGTNTVGDSGDRKVIGNSRARYNYGINLDLGYKNWSLQAFFQGVGKRNFYPSGSIFFPYRSPWDNLQTHQVGDIWTPDNPDAYFARNRARAGYNYDNVQTRYLQNAAYIRLRNLSIVYNLDQDLLDRLPISGLSISLNGTNLWDHHNLRAPFDPDGGNGLQAPFRRTYSLGVKVQL